MKPENIKTINRSKGEARVKTMIRAHLYWLSGFPYKIGETIYWCCPALSELNNQRLSVTPKMISKAHRIINELKRDYPVALPRVVGDADVWESRCKDYLEFTKGLYANQTHATIESLILRENSLNSKIGKKYEISDLTSELGVANSWMHYIDQKNLDKSFEFIKSFRGAMLHPNNIDIVLQSRLCEIYILDGSKYPGFIKLLMGTEGISTATNDGRVYINPFIQYRYNSKKNKSLSFPTRPDENTAKPILKCVDWILKVKTKQRKRALALLDSLEIDELINGYHQWWRAVDQLVAKISTLVKFPDENKHASLRVYQTSLEAYLAKFPENFDVPYLFSTVMEFSEHAALSDACCQFFKRYSEITKGGILKPRFLIHFNDCLDCGDININYFVDYLKAFEEYLRKGNDVKLLAPWGKLKGSYWSSCESDVFGNLKASQLRAFFEVLLRVEQNRAESLSDDWFEGVALIIASGFDVEDAILLSLHFIENKKIESLSEVPLKIAFEQEFDLDRTDKILDIWNKFDEEYTDDDTLEVIYKTFKEIDGTVLFNEMIFSCSPSVIRHCSNQIRIINKTYQCKEFPKAESSTEKKDDWVEFYPFEFHSTIAKINYVSLSAEKRVKKIFLKHWWPKEYLKIEVRKLTEQLRKSEGTRRENIAARLDSFKKRVNLHTSPSESSCAKLKSALNDCLKKEQLIFWRNEIDKLFKRCWAEFLEIESEQFPEWLYSEEMIRYLLPIADFNKRSKELAKYVMKCRCLSDDWLFQEHPKNELFLKRLREDGFNTDVWCEGNGEIDYRAKSSKNITINAVKDPLDVLNMGGHFKTCLTPGSFNYFSVFSNIADINKRVIYGKSSDGKVVGRVLVGLMPSGGVKVFNIYVHHSDDEFNSYVMKYIQSWVEKAGFTLTDHGEIPKLVSQEWYDDGSINVENSIHCLKPKSKFRKRLETIEAELLEKELQEELKPLPINELTFPLVVRLPEIDNRPDIIPALVKIALKIPRFGEYEIINLFNKAFEAEHGEQCFQAFRRPLINSLLRTVREENWFDHELAYRIAHYSPSEVLRIVKKQGSHWKGSWQENLYSGSARVAVKSLNMLGRPQQAEKLARMYKIAANE